MLAPPPPPPPAPAEVVTAEPDAPPSEPRGSRIPLAEPRPVVLPFEIRPVAGRRSALLIAQEPGHPIAHLRRITKAGVGPVRTVAGRHVATVIDGDPGWLVTTRGGQICVEPLDADPAPKASPAGDEPAPHCRAVRAHRALRIGDRPMLLEERLIHPDDPDEPREPGPPAKRRPDAERDRASKDDDAPTELRLWVRPLEEGRIGDVVNTGVRYAWPLVGMGLLDAAGTPEGAHLLWYEQQRHRVEGRRKIPRARLLHGRLDAEGKLVEASLHRVLEGDRAYGYIDGHPNGRLVVFGNRAAYVGRYERDGGKERGYEAIALSSPRGSVTAPDHVYGVDPARLARAEPLAREEIDALKALWAVAPRLTLGQTGRDMGRVAWVGETGWFSREPDEGSKLPSLHRVTLDAGRIDIAIADEPPPFVAERAPLSWATVEPSGAAIAAVASELVMVDPAGHLTHTERSEPDPVARPARIGQAWWALLPDGDPARGARLRRLHPDPLDVAVDHPIDVGRAAIAGGLGGGLLVALDHGRLLVWRLTNDGRAEPLGHHPTRLRHGLVAVGRGRGGAILAGVGERKRRVVTLALDAEGRLVSESSTTVAAGPDPWLRALPGGGAVLADAARTEVAWLDEAARERARAEWPSEAAAATCIDGEPARRQWPSTQIGHFVSAAGLAAPDTCLSDTPVALADGLLRWIGSTAKGMHSTAELGHAPIDAPVTPTPMGEPVERPPSPAPIPAPGPCPPEMVDVGGQFCIDRFESQLVARDSGGVLSPHYPTTPNLTQIILRRWAPGRWRAGDLAAQAMPLPPLLRAPEAEPTAVPRSRFGVVPSGYVSGHGARQACEAAGKRLCSRDEWRIACRGEDNRDFPYGGSYRQGVCNVFRYGHPAATLHGNPAIGHLDPRLNQVVEGDGPMLDRTGSRPLCASRWGDDAVYDMVGNLDEWVDDKGGAFVGGFYSRGTRKGCDAQVTAHPRRYLDYSLGTRCCSENRP